MPLIATRSLWNSDKPTEFQTQRRKYWDSATQRFDAHSNHGAVFDVVSALIFRQDSIPIAL